MVSLTHPFDRMILFQAISEDINIISHDEIFDEYLKPQQSNEFVNYRYNP